MTLDAIYKSQLSNSHEAGLQAVFDAGAASVVAPVFSELVLPDIVVVAPKVVTQNVGVTVAETATEVTQAADNG